MSNIRKTVVNTEPYARLNEMSMTPSEREEALYALELGEAIADAILWVSKGLARVARSSLKRGFKHQAGSVA